MKIFLYFAFISFLIIQIRSFTTTYTNRYTWNKRNEIPQLVKEEYDLIDYIYKNVSFKFFIRKNDGMSNVIRLKRYWTDCASIYNIWDEYNLWKYKYFFDVGANIGSCSILMLYKKVKIVAFEPIKNNQHLITKTLLLNNKYINNYDLYTIGLSNVSRKVTIYRNYKNWGGSSLYKRTNYPEEIIIFKLDDIKIDINEKIGMMKIDIECNELNMIEGGINFIKNHFIKVIYFEQYCDCYYKYNKGNSYHIYDLLRSLGYFVINQLNCTYENGKDVVAIKIN